MADGVTFNVRSSEGIQYPFTLNLETTSVADLKTQVALIFEVQTEEQRLYYEGTEMEDHRKLSFYGIEADTKVDLKEWDYGLRIHKGRLVDFTDEQDSSSESSKSGSSDRRSRSRSRSRDRQGSGSGSDSASGSNGSSSDSGSDGSGSGGSGSGGSGSDGYGSGSGGCGWGYQ